MVFQLNMLFELNWGEVGEEVGNVRFYDIKFYRDAILLFKG